MAADPQRDRIQLVCPECGHSQLEPALVISTVCRRCRAHLQVRDGLAVRRAAPSARAVLPEDVGPAAAQLPRQHVASSSNPGLAHWLTTWWRSKARREICCLGCGHRHQVVANAQSSQCPKCCTYASFANHAVDLPSNQRIDTRGNVVIGKKGRYYASSLRCHDLEVRGQLDAPVDCTGELRFRRSARVNHVLCCGALIIPRGVRVEFLQPVTTSGEVRIGGDVHGEITCHGKAVFERSSRFVGLVRAGAVEVKRGARFEGSTEILPSAPDPAG